MGGLWGKEVTEEDLSPELGINGPYGSLSLMAPQHGSIEGPPELQKKYGGFCCYFPNCQPNPIASRWSASIMQVKISDLLQPRSSDGD